MCEGLTASNRRKSQEHRKDVFFTERQCGGIRPDTDLRYSQTSITTMKTSITQRGRIALARLVRRLFRHYGFVIVRRSTLANWQGMTGDSPNGLGYRYALSDVIGQWPEQTAANTIPPNVHGHPRDGE
jgi:hypothetical protein